MSITVGSCNLTPRQEQAVALIRDTPARHFMCVGGSRSGKTFALCVVILARAVMFPGSRHAIFRHRMAHAKQSIWMDTLAKAYKLAFPVKAHWNNQLLMVRLWNDSEIWVGGLDDQERVEKILGQEHSTIYFNECSQIKYAAVSMALTRLAQKVAPIKRDDGKLVYCKNKALYDLNPVGMGHWTYRQFVQNVAPESLESIDGSKYAHIFMNPEDNAENIDPDYIDSLKALPEKHRRRFFDGVYVAEMDGQLWNLATIEAGRVSPESDTIPMMRRIVVAVDPSGADSEMDLKADMIGICVAGIGTNDHVYVFDDLTTLDSPEGWGRTVREAYWKHKADRVLGEQNFGGDMVRSVVQEMGRNRSVPYKHVNASRGKHVRAEPIAAMYEKGLVHHVGRFPRLEDELCNFTANGYKGSGSPNRADALVWALTELFEGHKLFGLLEHIASERREIEASIESVKQERALDHAYSPHRLAIASSEPAAPAAPPSPEKPVCPLCKSTLLARMSGQWHCNNCGHAWGGAKSTQQIGGARSEAFAKSR